jgi:hypothetical protein
MTRNAPSEILPLPLLLQDIPARADNNEWNLSTWLSQEHLYLLKLAPSDPA